MRTIVDEHLQNASIRTKLTDINSTAVMPLVYLMILLRLVHSLNLEMGRFCVELGIDRHICRVIEKIEKRNKKIVIRWRRLQANNFNFRMI